MSTPTKPEPPSASKRAKTAASATSASLADRWSQVGAPGSFSSARNVAQGAQRQPGWSGSHTPFSARQAREQLAQHVLFQAHRDLRQVFPRRHVAVTNFSAKWEMDLGEMPGRTTKKRKTEQLFLVAVDAFSRKIFARGLPNKTATAVAQAFDHVLDHLKPPYRAPALLETDRGKEFENATFEALCKKRNIRHKFAFGTHKARMAERAVRALKRVILAAKQSGHYPSQVKWPALVTLFAESLGGRHNRNLGMAPDAAPQHYTPLMQRAWDAKQLVGADQFFAEAEALKPGGKGLLVRGQRFRLGDAVLAPIPKIRRSSLKDKEFLMHYNLMPRVIDRVYHHQKPPLFRLRIAKSGRKEPRLYYGPEIKKITLPVDPASIIDYRVRQGGRGLEYQTEDKKWFTAP